MHKNVRFVSYPHICRWNLRGLGSWDTITFRWFCWNSSGLRASNEIADLFGQRFPEILAELTHKLPENQREASR